MGPWTRQAHKVCRGIHIVDERCDRTLLCLRVGLRNGAVVKEHVSVLQVAAQVGRVQPEGAGRLAVDEVALPRRLELELSVHRTLQHLLEECKLCAPCVVGMRAP